MRVISGHLTAHDKRAIKEILKLGLRSGKVGRTSFYLTVQDSVYTVCKQLMETRTIGDRPKLTSHYSTFQL